MHGYQLLRAGVVVFALTLFTSPAWCARADNGASRYGDQTQACPNGAGPGSATFGDISLLCFSPQSNLTGTATILDLTSSSASPIPQLSLAISFPGGDPTDDSTFNGSFGLITCDNNGSSVPCTSPASSSSVNMITSGNDLVITSGSPDSTTVTLGNVQGRIVLWFTTPALVTDITTPVTAAPEPRDFWLVGLGAILAGFALVRRRSIRMKAYSA